MLFVDHKLQRHNTLQRGLSPSTVCINKHTRLCYLMQLCAGEPVTLARLNAIYQVPYAAGHQSPALSQIRQETCAAPQNHK